MFHKISHRLTFCLIFLLCFQLTALGCPVPQPQTVTPAKGFNNEIVTVTIAGTNFKPTSQVKLALKGQPDINATEIVFSKQTKQLSCVFDLRDKTPGKWDLVIRNQGKVFHKIKTAILPAVFSIEYPAPVIASIQPTQGTNNAKVTVAINGTNFNNLSAITLNRSGLKDISANNIVVNANGLTCEFDLTTASPGKYNLTVIDQNGRFATLEAAFLIEGKPDYTKLKPILFDYDKYTIRVDQLAVLNNAISEINSSACEYIVLGGHSAEQGTKEYNLILSSKRAEAVKEYLVKNGVNPEKIIVFAYGNQYPVLGQSEANRRVDLALWQRKPTKEEAL